MCSGRVSSSRSTSGTHRDTVVTIREECHERKKDPIVNTTNGSHDVDRKIFEVITSVVPLGTLDSVASLVETSIYQTNHNRNHKPWKSYQLSGMYSICKCCWNVATLYINGKFTMGKIKLFLFYFRKS